MTHARLRLFTRPSLRKFLGVARAGGILRADRRLAAQEVEVAALVGLQHVIQEEAAVTPRVVRRAGPPPRAAMGKFIVGDPGGQSAGWDFPLGPGALLDPGARAPPLC